MYLLTGLGITIGYHRLFTHNAFSAKRPVRYALAVLGSMAVEGPLSDWVADHRKHHAHTDEEGDPHSPHTSDGSGIAGLWHAHIGWLLSAASRSARSFAEPRGAHGRAEMLWTGSDLPAAPRDVVDQLRLPLLRPPPLRRRRPLDERLLARAAVARRVVAPQPPRLPARRRPGPAPLRVDLSGLVIAVLERLGLAADVVRITPERQLQREAAPAAPRGVTRERA